MIWYSQLVLFGFAGGYACGHQVRGRNANWQVAGTSQGTRTHTKLHTEKAKTGFKPTILSLWGDIADPIIIVQSKVCQENFFYLYEILTQWEEKLWLTALSSPLLSPPLILEKEEVKYTIYKHTQMPMQNTLSRLLATAVFLELLSSRAQEASLSLDLGEVKWANNQAGKYIS